MVAAPGLLYLGIVLLAPLVQIVIRSLTDPGPANYVDALTDTAFLRALGQTLLIAACVSVACVVLGYPFAYAMNRSGPVLRTYLSGVLFISLWSSVLVRAFAWKVILSDTGIVNSVLLDLGLIAEPLPLIRNLFAVVVGMVHVLIPFAIIAMYNSIAGIDQDVERAARSLGASRPTILRAVTLPLSKRGALAGGVIVFVLSLAEFIMPSTLGGPTETMASQVIALQVQQRLNLGLGAAMAVVLVVTALVAVLVATRFVRIGALLGTPGAAAARRAE